MADEPVVFTVREAAAVFGVDERTAERWVRSGRIKPFRWIGRTPIFTGEEVARVAKLPRPKRGRPPRNVKPPPQSETLPEVC